MLTIVLSVMFGLAVSVLLSQGMQLHWAWSSALGLLTFVAAQLGSGWLLRRRLQGGMNAVNAIMTDGQQRLQRKMAQWQTRPPGSVKQAQQEIERDQAGFLRQALEASERLKRFYLWSPLLKRQVATLQMQLHYQLRDFDAVDRLMPHCLMLEPITRAMQMARLHQRKASDDELAKAFAKSLRRLRYGQGTILPALYSWILVKRGKPEAAHKVLVSACERDDHAVLKRNREHLANNRVKQFSNAGLGDEWYALGLEQPRVQARRQRPPRGRY